MKYIVLFEDNLQADPDIRRRYMQDHLDFLKANSYQVEAAGPLQTTESQTTGGLWVVTADSESEVTKLIESDPFWPTGLRKSSRIFLWTQVFANGKSLIKT